MVLVNIRSSFSAQLFDVIFTILFTLQLPYIYSKIMVQTRFYRTFFEKDVSERTITIYSYFFDPSSLNLHMQG